MELSTLVQIITLLEKFGKFGKFLSKFLKKRAVKKAQNNQPYFFDEYNKKVFVKNNGDGVIVASLILHVNDPEKTTHLIRTIDFSDAKKGVVLPQFEELLQTEGKEFFKDFGLWCEADNRIVTDIVEEYDPIDAKHKNDNRFLSFKIQLNDAALEKGKSYRITYAISIPGMYPIENGRFSGTVKEHEDYGKFRTSVSTYQTFTILTYSVYMEKGIVFSCKPKAFYRGKATKGEPYPNNCEYRNNMFYEKFNFTLENPQEYDIIYMEWDLKNQKPSINKINENSPELPVADEAMAVSNA